MDLEHGQIIGRYEIRPVWAISSETSERTARGVIIPEYVETMDRDVTHPGSFASDPHHYAIHEQGSIINPIATCDALIDAQRIANALHEVDGRMDREAEVINRYIERTGG